MTFKQPIGVFDSGLGGLSVLKQIYKLMPNEDYIFFGDSANAPYGIKSTQEVYELSKKITEMLINKYHVKAIVIACNTATSAAINRLREEYSIPIIGLEPAIKPAVQNNSHGKVIVMATPLTLAGKKFDQSAERFKNEATIIKAPAPDLVEYVERGELFSSGIKEYLHKILDDKLPVNAIVLGCTHFPFAQKAIQEVVGNDVEIYDGSMGAAMQLQRKLKDIGKLTSNTSKGKIEFKNSNPDPKEIELSQKLFDM